MQITTPQNAPLAELHTFAEWQDGKIFYNEDRTLCLDIFHGLPWPERHKNIRAGITGFKIIENRLHIKELSSIVVAQQDLYKESVKNFLRSKKSNFVLRISSEYDKEDYIEGEIELKEMVLCSERLGLVVSSDDKIELGRLSLSGAELTKIRAAIKDIKSKNQFVYQGLNSTKSPHHIVGTTRIYIETESDLHYLDWLKDLKKELQRRKVPVAECKPENLLLFYEQYLDHTNPKASLIKHYVEKYLAFETEVEAILNGYSSLTYHDVSLGSSSYFKKHTNEIIQQLKAVTFRYDTDKLQPFINQMYGYIKRLIKESQYFNEHLTIGEDDKLIRMFLHFGLEKIKEAIEDDYEIYLVNSDKNKITIHDFVHCILHEFNECNEKIYVKQHKPECTCIATTTEHLKKYKRKKINEFENRYKVIVKNWIDYNCDLGNCFDEKHFLRFAAAYMQKMFEFDEIKNVYFVKHQHDERFDFDPRMYKEQIIPFIDFFTSFFKTRMTEISHLPFLEHEHQPVINKPEPDSILNSFTYKNLIRDAGAITGLHKTMLGKEIAEDTELSQFKNSFSNKPVEKKIEWMIGKSALYYFIHQLKEKAKINDCDIWIAASNVFTLHGDPDYDIKKLAHSKPPKNAKTLNRINILINSI